MKYQDFLKAKQSHVKPVGFDVDAGDINQRLFDWQAQVVKWALRRGRAAKILNAKGASDGKSE